MTKALGRPQQTQHAYACDHSATSTMLVHVPNATWPEQQVTQCAEQWQMQYQGLQT